MKSPAPFPPFERDRAFAELAGLFTAPRTPIALVGAGISIPSGYPSWTELLRQMRPKKRSSGEGALWKKQFDDLDDAPWAAEVFARSLRRGELSKFIGEKFRSQGRLTEPHLTIAQMPFRHYLTINYDPSIEEALREAKRDFRPLLWSNRSDIGRFLLGMGHSQSDPCVVYLHGRFDSPERHIVLTERSYVARYVSDDDARRKLMAIFMTQPVVFVGFSMNDPDLSNIMREVAACLRSSRPTHYAIMSFRDEADREATRSRMEGKFGVRPVFYSRSLPTDPGGGHGNLKILLDALLGVTSGPQDILSSYPAEKVFVEADPEDPNRGRFGRASTNGSRRLVARRLSGTRGEGRLRLEISVDRVGGAELEGPVTFYLHPTFDRQMRTVEPREGRASIEIEAYGAFTVGARLDKDSRLELDLAFVPNLPVWFRRR